MLDNPKIIEFGMRNLVLRNFASIFKKKERCDTANLNSKI